MRLPRRGARIMIYAVLFAILAGAFVAAGFSAVNSEWVIAASGGIPILVTFLAASEREATQHAPEDTARELAKKLTAKVLANWTEEMENRGLKDDRRMELRWRAAEGSNASVGLGAGLAHEGTLSQLTDRIGHDTAEGRLPRLVVIGEMGGGKTACCVRLMVEIAERQSSNAELADWHRRVPVLFQLATWDPETSLQAWMIRQLPEIFPEIGTSGYERKVAALLVRRHVLPFLDGLDEVREPATALRAIDNQMTGRPFVLTCRTAEFACANDSGALRQAMIAELQGLRPDEVRGFLHRYEPRSPLIAMLEDQPAGPVAIVLSTPFMVSLARDADSSSPTLISAATTPDAEKATQRLLLETFIRKTYSHDDPDGPDEADDRTTLDEAWRYLQFLARQTDLAGRLAWWRLHRCVPAALFLVVAVCVGATVCSGLAALFFALFDHPWQGFWIGLGAGIAGALTAELIPQDDPRRARPRFRSLQIPMPFELARTVGFGLIGGAALAVIALFLYSSVPDIVLGSVLSGLTFALARYLSQPNDPLKVVTPGSLLRADPPPWRTRGWQARCQAP